MKRSMLSKVLILFTVVLGIFVSFAGSTILEANEGKFIIVTLKDKSEVKLEYDSFEFNWVIPRVSNDVTCKTHDFAKEEIVEIYVLNQTWIFCAKKEDWVFDVYLKDKKPIQGFFDLKAEEVTGNLFEGGAEQRIPYTNISKVTYH